MRQNPFLITKNTVNPQYDVMLIGPIYLHKLYLYMKVFAVPSCTFSTEHPSCLGELKEKLLKCNKQRRKEQKNTQKLAHIVENKPCIHL